MAIVRKSSEVEPQVVGADAPGVRMHLDAFVKANAPAGDGRGTLVVDAVDPKRRELLWRGWVSDEIDVKPTSEKRAERINEWVGAILRDFPTPR